MPVRMPASARREPTQCLLLVFVFLLAVHVCFECVLLATRLLAATSLLAGKRLLDDCVTTMLLV